MRKTKRPSGWYGGRSSGLIRHLLPQTLKGTLRFGFEDPSYTGQVLAAVSPFYGVYARSFTLIPEFEEKILEGEVHTGAGSRSHQSVAPPAVYS